MKSFLSALLLLALALPAVADEHNHSENIIILDEIAVKNLRIQTVTVKPVDFEETVFALGQIEPLPGKVGAVSSLVSGRVVALPALPGDTVTAGAEVIRIESRQPGQPPPAIGLKAPLSGVVTRLDVRLGDPVEPDRALLEIINLDEVLAVARVPEHFAGDLSPGAVAYIRLPAVPDVVFTGKLVRLGTAADTAAGTLNAYFALANPEHRLRPGMRAEFSLVTSRHRGVTAVPRSALQGTPASRFVYVQDFDLPNAFIKTPVVTGRSNDRFVEIISGLFPADEVVTTGAYPLSFAGAGTLSLKEALDAAHGHAHNEDGSEMTGNAPGGDHGHNHGDEDHAHPERRWMILSGVLAVALVLALIRRRRINPAA